MATFEHLATELLLQIISYLDSSLDLANFSIQNRQLYCLIEPLLEPMFRDLWVDGDNNVLETQNFISAIIEHPRLARHVRHVSAAEQLYCRGDCDCREYKEVESDEGWEMFANPIPYSRNPQHKTLFRRAIEARADIWSTSSTQKLLLETLLNINCSQCGTYDESNTCLFYDAAIAILAPLLPQPQTLELSTSCYPLTKGRGPKFGFFDDVAINGASALSFRELVLSDKCDENPGEIIINWFDELIPYDLLRTFHLAKAPSLRKISGHRIQCPNDIANLRYNEQMFKFPERFSNVVELDFRCSHINSKVLKAICSLPKSLEILRVSESSTKNVLSGERAKHSLSEIGEALRYHTKSLRVLELDLDKFIESPLSWYLEGTKSIGTFKDFQALKILAIGFRTFLVENDSGEHFEEVYPDGKTDINPFIDDDIFYIYNHSFYILEALPASLEVLLIYDYEKEDISRAGMRPGNTMLDAWFNHQSNQLAKLVEKRAEVYPNLKMIRGIDELVHGERIPSPLDELCEEMGMSMA